MSEPISDSTTQPDAQLAQPADHATPSWQVWMIAALAVAAAVRFAAWFHLRQAPFCGIPGFGDAIHYERLHALISGGFPETRLPWGSPLYPYAGAFLSTLFRSTPAHILLAQVLIGIAATALVAWSLAPLLQQRERWIAALLFGLHPVGAFLELRLQPTIFAVVLLLIVMRLLFLTGPAPRGRLLAGGLLIGLGFLLQPWLFFATAIAAAWHQRRSVKLAPVFTLAGFLALPLVASLYNSTLEGGGPTWNWSDAQAFHRALSGDTWGAARATDPPVWEPPDNASRAAYEVVGRRLSEWEVASFYRARGLQRLVENPLQWVGSVLSRAVLMVSRPEIPDPVSPKDVFARNARFLAWGLYLFPLYLALAGLAFLRRRSLHPGLLAVLTAVVAANVLGTYSTSSRWFFVVTLLPLSAAGLLALPATFSNAKRERRDRVALIAAVLIAGVSFLDLSRGSARYEDPAEDLRFRAQIAERLGDRRDAVNNLQRAAALDPRNAPARAALGVLLREEELPARAREQLLAALEIDPVNETALYALVEMAREETRYAEAESLAAALVSQHPQNPLYLNEYGVVLMMQGKFGGARFLFSQALQVSPDYQVAQMNLRAVDQAERDAPSVAFPPEMLPALDSPLVSQGQAALMAMGEGKIQTADSLTAALLNSEPETPFAWYIRGSFLYSANRSEEAVPLLLRVVERAPGRALTTESAARALIAAGRRADAEALVERSLAVAADERNRASIERLLGLIRSSNVER